MSVVIEVREQSTNKPLVHSASLKTWRDSLSIVRRADQAYHRLNLTVEDSQHDFRITFRGHINSIKQLLTDMLYLCEKFEREE